MVDHIITSQDEKLKEAFEFYDELLGTAKDRDFTLDLEELGLPQHDLSSLEVPFTEEVWTTICDLRLIMHLNQTILQVISIVRAGEHASGP